MLILIIYPSPFNETQIYTHNSKHTLGRHENMCPMRWAAQATMPREQLKVTCFAQGHFSHERWTLWIEPAIVQSQTHQFKNHQAMTSIFYLYKD